MKMNYEIYPKNEKFSTSLPITIEVEGKGPRLDIEGIGRIDLKGGQKKTAQIYFRLPGHYKLIFKDGEEVREEVITVYQHEYLDFKNEFGFFSLLFLIVMGGIILWTRKIMKKRTEEI